MPNSTAQAVIIGAGIMGASIAYHLAARGCTDVLILEQAETEISGSTARFVPEMRTDIDELRITRFAIERLHHELNIV
jgi:sarcosine oxidase subunit beta